MSQLTLPEPKWAPQALAHWDVKSFTTKDVYRVYLKPGGTDWFCQCLGYRFAKGSPKPDCKHIRKVKGIEQIPVAQLSQAKISPKTVVVVTPSYTVIQTRREVSLTAEEDY